MKILCINCNPDFSYFTSKGLNLENELQHQAIMDSLKFFHETTRETLAKLLEQTTKTNGRVNKLENWQGFIKGGLAIVSVILLPLAFIVIGNAIK